jgi:hypothetical protein
MSGVTEEDYLAAQHPSSSRRTRLTLASDCSLVQRAPPSGPPSAQKTAHRPPGPAVSVYANPVQQPQPTSRSSSRSAPLLPSAPGPACSAPIPDSSSLSICRQNRRRYPSSGWGKRGSSSSCERRWVCPRVPARTGAGGSRIRRGGTRAKYWARSDSRAMTNFCYQDEQSLALGQRRL